MSDANTYYKYVEDNGIAHLVSEPSVPYGVYTYADYLLFKIEERIELIKGKILKMSSPNLNHQTISNNINWIFNDILRQSNCRVFAAPFDVRIPTKNKKQDEEIITVVQPDVMVVCDESKLDSRGICGTPDLVIEILSPSNSKRELKIKYDLYEEVGVKEYWIIFPDTKSILVYNLVDGKFVGNKPYAEDGFIESRVLSNIKIDIEEIFKHVK